MLLSTTANNVLFEFDSIIDTDIGAIRLLLRDYSNPKYINPITSKDSFYTMLVFLKIRKEMNPLLRYLKPEYHSSADAIYNEIMEEHYSEVLELSMHTGLYALVPLFMATPNASIKVTILCKNETQKQYIKSINKEWTCRLVNSDDFDMDNYDSIYIKDFPHIMDYKKLYKKNIYICDYEFNVDYVYEDKIPKAVIAILVGSVNRLAIIEVYPYITMPSEGGENTNNEGEPNDEQ